MLEDELVEDDELVDEDEETLPLDELVLETLPELLVLETLPELLVLPVAAGLPKYLAWIADETGLAIT